MDSSALVRKWKLKVYIHIYLLNNDILIIKGMITKVLPPKIAPMAISKMSR